MRAKNVDKTEKRQKRTQYMCKHMLRWIRLQMRFEPRDMRATLALPGEQPIPRRTYQDYEAGNRAVPRELATRIREAYRRDHEFKSNICRGVKSGQFGPCISPGEVLRLQRQAEFETTFPGRSALSDHVENEEEE